jgi:VWFA-related protein
MSTGTVAIVLNAFWVCNLLSAQSPSPSDAAKQTTVIRATRREVLVDVVVRDKHHRLITDLRPEEVKVYEDGVQQNINVFQGVQGTEQLETERSNARVASAVSADGSESTPPVTSLRQLNFVAIVFADIAPLNLEFARTAVLEFLKSDNLPNTYVSVYRLNRNLKVVQMYTDSKEMLTKAVDAATKGLHTDDGLGTGAKVVGGSYAALQAAAANILSSPQVDLTTQTAVRNALLNPMPTIARDPLFARDAVSQDVSVTLGQAILSQALIENGIRFASSLSNGMDALDSLHEIIRSQQNLPGRKVVLYLADGLELPMNRRDAVDNLISYSNRSGVAFYGVDTRGLNVEDPMMRSLSELERTGAVSSAQVADPISGHKEDDGIQLTAVANKQLALREVAEATGGFAVADTNEIAAPMRRVMEDIRSHYELAYTPTATTYDGHFRKIEVKINRPHVTVQSRKGYFALPDLNGVPIQPFEAVALSAINSHPSSMAFPYNVAVMKFRPRQDAVEHQVAFEVPLSGLRVAVNSKTGKSSVKASLVALIHNSAGEVVGEIGRQLTREVPTSQSARLASDRILYAEPVDLPGGHYVIDAAVTDEESGKTAVRRLAFFVDSGKDLGLSSLELVRGSEGATEERNSGDPSAVGGRILPVLSDSLASGKPVDLYFIVYPAKLNSGESPKVMLQVLHDGREIARKPLTLPRPDADGSVPIMLRLSPTPGQCDILVTAQQGTLVAQSSLSVKVE